MGQGLTSDPLFARSLPLLGESCLRRLSNVKVAIFGLGGVGSFAAEALARLGIGNFLLVDGDTIDPTNLNRQLYALRSTVGKLKTELAGQRILDINPAAKISLYSAFVTDTDIEQVLSLQPDTDVIVDAIDSVKTKIALIVKATRRGTPIFSSMGAGFKIDPTRVQCQDLAKTHTDPLARIMRRELKALGIVHLPVVFSDEPARAPVGKDSAGYTDINIKTDSGAEDYRKDLSAEGGQARLDSKENKADAVVKSATPASCSLVPPAFGLALASLVLKHILDSDAKQN